MRFKSGKVKFVAVDEPSSALDAEGELQLFERLIAVREGKTMVFVTHRFGHLTKHADRIMYVPFSLFYLLIFLIYVLIRMNHFLMSRCMKEGKVVETGTHEQLMELKGEYAKLYNIQASAFASAS
jgi:ABC-type multidrug transport system fused ATPase/permease subunit